MRFVRFGITLERLDRGDLELVRQWRNSDWVRPFMRFQQVVTPDEQTRWFARLDPSRDWYFCAHTGASPFGLFHVKAIDWTRKVGEAGGFVGSPQFIGRPEPALATLALMDFAFSILRLRELEAQYRTSLPRIARFNKQLGYEVFREDTPFVRARVSAGRYFRCARVFREAAAAVSAMSPHASVWAREGVPGVLEWPDEGPNATFGR
jgi:UDP-4-amino-4,6-dideoxy-N-acetyl-beta-L-altrosamine N-acetyltransferase